MRFIRHIPIAALISCSVAVISACGGGNDANREAPGDVVSRPASSDKQTGSNRRACDLLTVDEVSTAMGVRVTPEETDQGPGHSICHWATPDGLDGFDLEAYWTGGKEAWKIEKMARGMAGRMIQKSEGVALDSVVKVGPVPGLGDSAVFSPLLQSLVLKDDILLEFLTARLPNPAARFKPLAEKALSRL